MSFTISDSNTVGDGSWILDSYLNAGDGALKLFNSGRIIPQNDRQLI